jgi:hypothetical protein
VIETVNSRCERSLTSPEQEKRSILVAVVTATAKRPGRARRQPGGDGGRKTRQFDSVDNLFAAVNPSVIRSPTARNSTTVNLVTTRAMCYNQIGYMELSGLFSMSVYDVCLQHDLA